MTFEVGIVETVRASHVMPGRPLPEGEPHWHDYRVEVTIERDDLDEAGMVVDLDVLRSAFAMVMADVAEASLDERLGAPGTTVERFAVWAHARIGGTLGHLEDGTMRVRVWEGTDAFGGYRATVG